MNNYYNFRGQDMMKQYNPNNYKEEKNSLYEPYQGFIRGNLYKDLYDPYKVNGPYEIKPMNEQAELLTYIDALCFACTDLNLYLDVYPDNKEIINLYNRYNEEKKNLMKQYEAKFGPLVLDSESLNSYPWSWDDRPWPWEGN